MSRILRNLALLRSLPAAPLVVSIIVLIVIPQHTLIAQGDPSNIQSALPAFNEPKFKDKLFAAGGPMVQDAKNGKVITQITIEGNQSISKHNILSRMQTREERKFDSDVLSRDMAELYRTGFFKSVHPSFIEDQPEGTLQIRLVVSENPTIRSVTFHGNTVYSDKKLLKYCGFQVGDPMSPHTVLAARNRLEDYYKSEGFNQASVEVYQGDKPNDRDIGYRISEGHLERVRHIAFVGNTAFSSDVLKTKISSKDSDRFIPKLTTWFGNKAHLDQLEQDHVSLLEFYRSLGYFDARIDPRVEYEDNGKWLNVTFVVFEGEPYTVRNVSVEGNRYYPSEKIQPYLSVHSNNPYRQVKKAIDERFIQDAYGAVGFIFCDVVARLELEPETHLVDIVYEVEEGDIYRCSDINIHIEGDKSYTKERVALNYLGNLRPNAIIDGVELNNATRRLSNSTIFETNPASGVVPRVTVKPWKFEEESEFDR